MLKINSKKTKVMVFQKGKYKCDYVFHIGNEIFDTMISPILTYRSSELWILSHGITPESKKLIYTFLNDI